MPQLLVFVLFFAGVYFLLLRPQQQRVRRQRELITAIGVGDRVVTAGGLIGRVIEEADDRLLLEISDGVVVEFLRLSISRRLDESESAFVSMSDDAELEGGYEEESASDEDASGPEDESAEVSSEEVEEAFPSELGGSPAESAGGHVPGAAAPPVGGTTGPDGSTPGAAAPAPGQDPH